MRITGLKRFSVHDGPGIRTTVFFKGCPLRCRWCHNPETQRFDPEVGYFAHKCQSCGQCLSVCPSHAHSLADGVHAFDPALCMACGACADACRPGAMEFYGQEIVPEALLPRLMEDIPFYRSTGGGVTLSGGECLSQPADCVTLLRLCRESGLHTAVDTCGHVSPDDLAATLPYTDLYLYDLKHSDTRRHAEGTGAGNERILANLAMLLEHGAAVEIRIPLIPGFNTDAVEDMGRCLLAMGRQPSVRLLDYHDYAGAKYRALGRPDSLSPAPAESSHPAAAALLRGMGLTVLE